MVVCPILSLSIIVVFIGYSIYVFLKFNPIELQKEMPKGFENQISIKDSDIDPKIFAASLTYKTITYTDGQNFYDMFEYLEGSFPYFTEKFERKDFEYGIMYRWKGTDENLSKNPILYLAHADVVPVDEEDLKDWKEDPFGGKIVLDEEDGEMYIYGRGTIDYKIGVVGMMAAFDQLVKSKFQPKRDILLMIGLDEETIDGFGAKGMAKYLRENDIRPRFILDEGGFIFTNFFRNFGQKKAVALINLAEKGVINVNVSFSCVGGHSSMPPWRDGCAHKLARIIQKMIDKPVPAKSDGFLIPFFKHVFPHTSLPYKYVFSIIGSLPTKVLELIFSKTPGSNAMMRTTVAPTIIKMGEVMNVLPNFGHVLLNIRIIPGDTVESVLEHMKKKFLDEDGVEIVNLEMLEAGKDSRFSNEITESDTVEFEMIVNTIRNLYEDKLGEVVFTPCVMVGGSDMYYYRDLSDHVFNFLPVVLDHGNGELGMLHGNNERISVDYYKRAVKFYALLMKNLQKLD